MARRALVKQPISRFILKEDEDIYCLHKQNLLKTGQPQAFELRMLKKDGTVFWAYLSSTVAVAMDASRAPECHMVLSDITERKQAEEALTLARDRTIAILDSISDAFFTIDSNMVVAYFNHAAETALGRKAEDVVGRKLLAAFPEARGSIFEERYALALNQKIQISFETYFSVSPYENWYDVRVYPNPEGISVYFQLITERKQAEEALARNQAMLLRTENIAHVGSWEWDVATDTATWSDEMFRIFQRNPAEGALSFAEHPKFYFPEDMARLRLAVETAIIAGTPYELELRIIRADGDNRTCLARGFAEIGPDGKVTRLFGSFQDITERKRAEEEKAKLDTQLLQAQKMESVGRLAGGVAHDFNNMLQVILAQADMAKEAIPANSPVYENLNEICICAQRSDDLTRQLLAFARKQTIAPKVLDLNETVAGMLKMLQRLIGENIDLHWQPAAKLWSVRVDPSQIDQILANLCVNARDAIADVGTMTIETGNSAFDQEYCAAHPGFAPGEYVRIVVSDNGYGMDQETLAHIFEPFYPTKGVGEGTGLGLAMVYGAVKQNDGFINAYSEPGLGATFTIYLPRHVDKAEQMRTEGISRPDARGHKTILLAEDEPAILRLTTSLLERLGYRVLSAPAPGEAIRLAREYAGDIHLLMTDVVMPEMNGRDLAKTLLSLYPNLKRLFTSGYTADVIAHQGVLEAGVYFIQKPFSMKELAAIIRKVLDSE